jgi:hypothetical protein
MAMRLGIAALQLMNNLENIEKNLKNFEIEARNMKREYPWIDLVFTGELYLQD